MTEETKARLESELEVNAYIQSLKYALNNGAKVKFQGHNSIIDLKDIPCEEVDMGETNAYHFSLKEETLFPALTEEDRKVLDVVIEKLGKMTKKQIVSFMHKEQAYIETAPKDIIPFKYAANLQI